MQKIIFSLILVFCTIFFLISFGRITKSFLQSKTLEIESYNVGDCPLDVDANGVVFAKAVPILTSFAGTINFNVEKGKFIDEGEVVGTIRSNESSHNIIAGAKGLFCPMEFSHYEVTDENGLISSHPERFVVREIISGEKVKEDTIIGSVIVDTSYYILLNDVDVPQSKTYLTLLFDDPFLEVEGEIITRKDRTIILKVDGYLNYFIDREHFKIRKGFVKGITVTREEIVEKGGMKGLMIVNGNRAAFMETSLYEVQGDRYIAQIQDYNSILVIKNPRFVSEGELIGAF